MSGINLKHGKPSLAAGLGRRDAAAALIATAAIMLLLGLMPAVAMGGIEGLASPSPVPASGPVKAAAVVAPGEGVMPAVTRAGSAVVRQNAAHGSLALDQAPSAPTPSATAEAQTTPAVKIAVVKAQPKAQPAKAAQAVAKPAAKVAKPAPVLAGTNHFWFPALGISNKVHEFNCAGPDTIPSGIWHFGCNGPRNIYLMAHGWSDFKAVRVAYHNGALSKGMTAYYAGPDGTVQRYKVAWVRHVPVDEFNASYWEWAINDVPAVTLQTCDGAHSEYRIIVRLVPG